MRFKRTIGYFRTPSSRSEFSSYLAIIPFAHGIGPQHRKPQQRAPARQPGAAPVFEVSVRYDATQSRLQPNSAPRGIKRRKAFAFMFRMSLRDEHHANGSRNHGERDGCQFGANVCRFEPIAEGLHHECACGADHVLASLHALFQSRATEGNPATEGPNGAAGSGTGGARPSG